ncbi:MAG TPA: DUF3168 domain-containing protein [Gemmataceae bacterium]|nr:DUF3168 domain-containing protein [Gemmataceae bacterium]
MADRTTVIEDLLAAWLAARPAVASDAGGRVYPWEKVPQNGPKPYLTYHRITGGRLRSLAGPTTGVSHPLIQIDVWGDYASVKRIGDAVRQDLEQVLPQTEIGGHRVQACIVHNDADDAEDPLHGDEATECRVRLDTTIWFEEQGA